MVGVQSGRGLQQLGRLFTRGAIGQKTDAELLELFARGDEAEDAFEALVVRHGPAVLRACRRILPDPNDAEDAFQATFLILARCAGANAIGRPESLGPWLHGVALRVARKARVAAARRRRHEGRAASQIVLDYGDQEDLPSVLREELDGLPEALKAPVVFCYLKGMTYQGAARLLRVSEGTIRGRLARARELLRVRLSRQEKAVPTGRRDVLASRPPVSGVSPALIGATIRAAMTLTPGGVGSVGISATVAELMEGVLTMMLVTRWMFGALAGAVIALAAVGGAAVAAMGPDDKAGVPQVRAGATPAASADAPQTQPPEDEAVEPPPPAARPARVMTLDAAIELLMKKNLDAIASKMEVPRADAEVLTVNLRANPAIYARTWLIPAGGFTSLNFLVPPGSDGAISADGPVVLHLKGPSSTRPTRAAKTIAEAQLQDAIRKQLDSLYTTYIDVQSAQEKVQRGRQDLYPWWQSIRASTNREKNGIGERNEFRSSLIAYQIARKASLNQEEELARTRRALALALDLPQADAGRLQVEEIVQMQPVSPFKDLRPLALDVRPDLAALRLGLVRAHANVESSRKQAVQGSEVYILPQPYTFGKKDSSASVKTEDSYELGVATQLPDSRRNQGNITRAKLNLAQTQIQVAAAERQICEDVERCQREWSSDLRELPGLKHKLDLAVEARDVAMRSFEAGQARVNDLIKALREHDELERQYVELLVKHRRNVLELNTVVGQRILP